MTEKNKPAMGSQLLRGAVWMIAMRWMMRGIGLMSTVVLARLLTPGEFGVMAVALIVVGLLEAIAYLGVDLSLIKDQSAEREQFDTAWTIQLIQGVIVAALLFACAPIVAGYFNEPRSEAVIAFLALRPIIDGLQNIGLVTFRKELDFAREFRFNMITKLLGVVIQIGAAVVLRNYWALVIGMIAASVLSTVMSYLMHPYRPCLSLARARDIWSFSQWLLVSRVGAFFNKRSDEFVVGRLAGTTAMGSYHVVYELASAPTAEIIMPMRRALFPSLSKVAGDAQAFRTMVLDTLRASTVICAGLGIGLACCADLVVPIVLGDKWLSTIPVLRWLALFGVSTAISLVLEVPLWVAGRTHLSAVSNWLELALVLPLLYFATQRWGAEGAAAGRLAASLCMVPVAGLMVRRTCGVGFRLMAKALARPLTAGATMAAAMLALPLPPGLPLALQLLARIGVGATTYCLALWLLWRAAGRPPGFEAGVMAAVTRRWDGLRQR